MSQETPLRAEQIKALRLEAWRWANYLSDGLRSSVQQEELIAWLRNFPSESDLALLPVASADPLALLRARIEALPFMLYGSHAQWLERADVLAEFHKVEAGPSVAPAPPTTLERELAADDKLWNGPEKTIQELAADADEADARLNRAIYSSQRQKKPVAPAPPPTYPGYVKGDLEE